VFEWRIESLLFKSGAEVRVAPSSVLVLIGPNGSGKSTLLREIELLLQNPAAEASTKILSRVNAVKNGSAEDMADWLGKSFPRMQLGGLAGQEHLVARGGAIVAKDALAYTSHVGTHPQLVPFLCARVDTESRLPLSRPVQSIKPFFEQPSQYIHFLLLDDDLYSSVAIQVRRAFGFDLIAERIGQHIGFHVGDEPRMSDRGSPAYAAAIARLPTLEDAGDGVRSFAGALLAAKCGAQPVLLLDEPEAFLHPPQASRLAAVLAESAAQQHRQIFISTHSSDVVQGVLATSRSASVCRLTRTASENTVCQLESEQLQALWSKPLLRSAAAVDGVFHRAVVVTEAEADSRYYQAVLRDMEQAGAVSGPTDVYFVDGGGKGELATLATVYRKLEVATAVIADLDVLQNRAEVEKLVAVLGSSVAELEPEYSRTVAALGDLKGLKSAEELAQLLGHARDRIVCEQRVAPEIRAEVGKALDQVRDWSTAKRFGIRKLRGEAHTLCVDLLTKCRRIGLHIVPVGELESWWLEGPAEKSRWFAEAMERFDGSRHPFPRAQMFMVEVARSLGIEAAADTTGLFSSE
jgi:ABC-type transport system involved in cytochrome c biogenesis ATPase subunit